MARQYPRARGPLMASPPSSGGHVEQGESGVLIGGHLVLGTGWAVALSADQSAVSEGDERWLFRGVRVDQRIGIRARGTGWEADAVLIRAVRTVREDAGLGQGTRRTHRHRMRIRLRVPITTSGIVTLGGDWALLDRPLRSGSTVLTAALDWRPGARLRCRIGLTDHLVARGSRPVIVYEADTPLAYPLRSLSGSGRRLYGLVSWTSGDTTLSIAASRGVRDRIDPLASPDRSSAISVALASGI